MSGTQEQTTVAALNADDLGSVIRVDRLGVGVLVEIRDALDAGEPTRFVTLVTDQAPPPGRKGEVVGDYPRMAHPLHDRDQLTTAWRMGDPDDVARYGG